MVKEIILIIASLIGIIMALTKRDIVFTIVTFGLAGGVFIFVAGVQTINIGFFIAFVILNFLLALGQKGIRGPNRTVLALISGLVLLAEVAIFQEWGSLYLFHYGMIIPMVIYFFALAGSVRVERGLSSITIIAADALAIFILGFV